MAFTTEQINKVCADVNNALKGIANINIQSFLSTPIINGMTNNDTADEIADACYESVKGIHYDLVTDSKELNILQIVSGVIHTDIAEFLAENPEQEEEPEQEEVVTITSVTLNKSTTSITKGESETLTATVVASPDEAANKTVTWSLSETTDKVTVVDGVVTVADDADIEEITVTATSTVDNTKSDSCVITIL
jgi:uncharacterized protein YjdB